MNSPTESLTLSLNEGSASIKISLICKIRSASIKKVALILNEGSASIKTWF